MALGLYLMSYPEENAEWAPWSSGLQYLGTTYFFPANTELARWYPGVGVEVFVLGVMFNPMVKRGLSHRWLCWIGKMSFAVYLIHAPLLRTILTYMIYGLSPRTPSYYIDEHGQPLPPGWRREYSRMWTIVAVPIFYVILYRLAASWVKYVDPWCGRVTNWVERQVFRDEGDLQQEKGFLMNGSGHANGHIVLAVPE
jgi:hypothetical protein